MEFILIRFVLMRLLPLRSGHIASHVLLAHNLHKVFQLAVFALTKEVCFSARLATFYLKILFYLSHISIEYYSPVNLNGE